MNVQNLFNIKSKFVSREVGNELILVPLTDNVARMSELFTLNETGRFIWEHIGETTTLEDLKNAMTESFDIDRETAGKDIEAFLQQLGKFLIKD